MSLDEYAEFEAANGADLISVDGTWWREVRPFFYQPLFPFLELKPFSTPLPPGAFLGGFQHNVPSPATANSARHFFIYDDVRTYSMDALRHQRRSAVKKGLELFSIRCIEDAGEFVSAGYPVYRSFYERTRYSYKKERIDKKKFAHWAGVLYRFPKVKVLGAYHGSELCSIDISYLVEDVLFEATAFSKTEYLKYCVVDAMVHTLRKTAAGCPGISTIYKGVVTGNANLDYSKVMRGCRIVSKPAFYRLNPLAYIVLRIFLRKYYEKLLGTRDGRRRHPGVSGLVGTDNTDKEKKNEYRRTFS
jgi:hypothetical protein